MADQLRELARQFSRGGAAHVLRTYLKLHTGKLGMHWLWAIIERLAAGEPEARLLRDYGLFRENDEVIERAFALADSTARADIESCTSYAMREGNLWCDTATVHLDDAEYVAEALRYLELRASALPYKVIRDGAEIRFCDGVDR